MQGEKRNRAIERNETETEGTADRLTAHTKSPPRSHILGILSCQHSEIDLI